MKKLIALTAIATLAGVTTAAAHAGHENTSSFVSGLLHPLGGLDHMLAMIAVGIWAALVGGNRIYWWPVSFVAAMLLGFGLAAAGVSIPLIEPGILASVVITGLLIALALKLPCAVGCIIVGLFALFHGAAHGLEAPGGSLVGYALGFSVATSCLLLAGLGFGTVATGKAGKTILRVVGGLFAAGGLALAFTA
ncbi:MULTISPECIES: HupE/UreJ family protein [Pseudovibrio]|uniref:HupE/UreJ family protein n=1 Tax=Stappiaceae TaxID=2821832 RepID=UPI002365BE65|nr:MULTISPECIES: HupE/UreJ family protein [Pseudovibrio]MDD7911666.1 HupE/UreJ family protein [Pseudovibrio exalbescens]MDX5594399.1 HupE/UreJ family protein [Pseudovibrio sp. SPO723]